MVQRQQEEIEYLKRIGKRQAASFARRHWVEKPKRPGRKAGKGKFAHRELPKVVKITETKEAKLDGCPDCGGHLQAIRKHEQFVTDTPVVEVKTTQFVTYSGYCTSCHKRVRSEHPEQTSQATGAAGVMVGPRAKALAADLKHRLGGRMARSVKCSMTPLVSLSAAARGARQTRSWLVPHNPSMYNCWRPSGSAAS